MSILSRLFGSGAKREAQELPADDYNGFRITPAPQEESDGYRVGARIEKEIGGEVKVHHFLRADVVRDRDEAAALSLRKAKQVIDEQGERIFR
ncbi:MAG: HlyU family transcriptional regulator [Roseovarius sp.]|nr:HlyU family transcriptional regulator [Roseovarius sp.]